MKKERLDRAWRTVLQKRGQEGERKASAPTRAGGGARTQGRGDNFASHGPTSQHLGSDGSRDPCMASQSSQSAPSQINHALFTCCPVQQLRNAPTSIRNKNLTRPLLAMRYVSLLRRAALMHRTRLSSRAQPAILGPCCELRRLCRCPEQRDDDDMHRATPSVFAFMAAICIAPAFGRPRMPRAASTVYVRQPSFTVFAHLGQYTFGLLHRRTVSVATFC
jgi:hypothetical protein